MSRVVQNPEDMESLLSSEKTLIQAIKQQPSLLNQIDPEQKETLMGYILANNYYGSLLHLTQAILSFADPTARKDWETYLTKTLPNDAEELTWLDRAAHFQDSSGNITCIETLYVLMIIGASWSNCEIAKRTTSIFENCPETGESKVTTIWDGYLPKHSKLQVNRIRATKQALSTSEKGILEWKGKIYRTSSQSELFISSLIC